MSRIEKLLFVFDTGLVLVLTATMSEVLLDLLKYIGLWPPSAIVLGVLAMIFIGVIVLSMVWLLRHSETAMKTKAYASLWGMTSIAYFSILWAIDCIGALS